MESTSRIPRVLLINVLVLIVLAVGAAFVDARLSPDNGLSNSFYLLTLVASIVQLLINLGLSIFFWVREKHEWGIAFFVSGFVLPIFGSLIAYGAPRIAATLR
ncbi:MAG: hypothetical protein ACP5GX_04755 [Anaerolineae bacterium]